MENDSSERIAFQLISFVRTMKEMHGVAAPTDAPALERPAFIALWYISEAGQMRSSVLADSLCVDLSTASRQVAALEQAGWIARERDPDDRRAHLIQLTAEGERVLRSNQLARRLALTNVLADWPESERKQFADFLGRFNEAIQKNTRPANTAGADGRS